MSSPEGGRALKLLTVLADSWREAARSVNDPRSPSIFIVCAEELEEVREAFARAIHDVAKAILAGAVETAERDLAVAQCANRDLIQKRESLETGIREAAEKWRAFARELESAAGPHAHPLERALVAAYRLCAKDNDALLEGSGGDASGQG